jgi:hypothetical protein
MNRKKGAPGPMSPALGQKPDPRYLYVCEGLTLDEIVERYKGVRGYSKRSLARRSSAEMWKERRRQHLRNAGHTAEVRASKEADAVPPPAETPIADTPAVGQEDRFKSKVIQARELMVDGATLALNDVRKVLLADKLRIVSDDGTAVAEIKIGMREKEQAMRIHAHAAASLRGLPVESRPEVDAEMQKLQREKLAAEVELLRHNIKRAQGSMPNVLNDIQDDDDSIEKLYERITSLLADSSSKKPSS